MAIIEVNFDDERDKERSIAILERALEDARAGKVIDVAVATVEREPNGQKTYGIHWYGLGDYSALCTAIAALQFDTQYKRIKEAEEGYTNW